MSMKHIFGIVFVLLFIKSGSIIAQNNWKADVQLITAEQLLQRVNIHKDTIYVVNFWASWCKPCVEELPLIENIDQHYENTPVKIVLASIDSESQIETQLKPFLKEHFIMNEVVVIKDGMSTSWTTKINKEWSGSIPSTLFIYQEQKTFFEGQVDPMIIENALKEITENSGEL